MTLAEWKDFLDVVKTLVEASAILAGGIWATYTFGSLRQIARARAEIANTEAARKKTEAEIQQLTERAQAGAVVEIDLTASTWALPNVSGLLLSVLAEVSNKGNRNVQIEYPDHPFTAYAVTGFEGGAQTYTPVATADVRSSVNPSKRSLKLLVRAGGRERIPFLVRVPGPGLYMLVLTLPLPKPEQEIAERFGFVSTGRWSAKRYFLATAPMAT